MNDSPYIHPLTLAYHVCDRTGWTISSERMNFIVYTIALFYAGEVHEMLLPNLFEVDSDTVFPTNQIITDEIGHKKLVKKSDFPQSVQLEHNINDEEIRNYINGVIKESIGKSRTELFGVGIVDRKRNGKFINSGELSLQDMINQYNSISQRAK